MANYDTISQQLTELRHILESIFGPFNGAELSVGATMTAISQDEEVIGGAIEPHGTIVNLKDHQARYVSVNGYYVKCSQELLRNPEIKKFPSKCISDIYRLQEDGLYDDGVDWCSRDRKRWIYVINNGKHYSDYTKYLNVRYTTEDCKRRVGPEGAAIRRVDNEEFNLTLHQADRLASLEAEKREAKKAADERLEEKERDKEREEQMRRDGWILDPDTGGYYHCQNF